MAHIDGGARGNPGPAAAAGVIRDESGRQTHLCAFLGVTTNNVAEYLALIWVLEEARRAGVARLRVFTDSELLVRQLSGAYRVKSPRLMPLHRRACGLLRLLPGAEVHHVPREQNRAADSLVNRTLDWAAQYLAEVPAGEQGDGESGRPSDGGECIETGT
ncbi:MAG: ribonuclease HI family protein [Bacillota bacterium]|nr:ribonuclease HI family protein [Bacillota bacterium]